MLRNHTTVLWTPNKNKKTDARGHTTPTITPTRSRRTPPHSRALQLYTLQTHTENKKIKKERQSSLSFSLTHASSWEQGEREVCGEMIRPDGWLSMKHGREERDVTPPHTPTLNPVQTSHHINTPPLHLNSRPWNWNWPSMQCHVKLILPSTQGQRGSLTSQMRQRMTNSFPERRDEPRATLHRTHTDTLNVTAQVFSMPHTAVMASALTFKFRRK